MTHSPYAGMTVGLPCSELGALGGPMKPLLFLFSFVAFLSGCQRGGPNPPTPGVSVAPPVPAVAPAPTSPGPVPHSLILAARVIALEGPNQYTVQLDWHEGSVQTESWVIQRETPGARVQVLAKLEERVREYRDAAVAAGQSYRYSLWLQRGTDTFLHALASVTIPRDLEVRGDLATSEISGIARLFLAEGSRLRPTEKGLLVRVQEIHSDQGIVESFPPGQKAALDLPGRHGPEIRIEAERGAGRLLIVKRGEHGGNGHTGNQGKKGEDGRSGNPAVLQRLISPGYLGMDEAKLAQYYERLEQAYPSCDGIWSRYYVCVDPPNNGGDNGGTGKRGGDGASGGKTSALWINIADASRLDLRVSEEPGLGGTGGAGGVGGLGGYGGKRGATDKHCLCRPAEREGRNGPLGLRGIDGASGANGTVAPSCVRLGPLTQGDCAYFERE